MKHHTPLSKRDPDQCPYCLARLNLDKMVKDQKKWHETNDKYLKDQYTLADNADNEDDLHYNNEIIQSKIDAHRAKYPHPICPKCFSRLVTGYYDKVKKSSLIKLLNKNIERDWCLFPIGITDPNELIYGKSINGVILK